MSLKNMPHEKLPFRAAYLCLLYTSYFEKPDGWNIPAFNYWNESDVEVDNRDAGEVEAVSYTHLSLQGENQSCHKASALSDQVDRWRGKNVSGGTAPPADRLH